VSRLVWHPDFARSLMPRHGAGLSKLGHLHRLLLREGLIGPNAALTPAPAGSAAITRVHHPAYVERVMSCSLGAEEVRRIGLPATQEVARRAALACSAALMAAEAALAHGFAASLAGGAHHAGPNGGAGYCVFNDAAFAAQALLDTGRVNRVLILDLDVHQGDGTARIFTIEPRVRTVSMHAERNFPARKARSDIDLGLPDRTGDADYLRALDGLLARVLAERFDLAIYNAGVDPCRGDRLGRLDLSREGLAGRERMVLSRLDAAGIPVAVVMGGGYGEDPAEVAGRHFTVFAEAARLGLMARIDRAGAP